MDKILILGAGLSSSCLINYLLKQAQKNHWKIRVGDISPTAAEKKTKGHPNGEAFGFNVSNTTSLAKEIEKADVVISLLPASLHPIVAKECVRLGRHMFTASYVSNQVIELNQEAQKKDLLILNEIGVDPGIDHMSAMKAIDEIKAKGGKLLSFCSNTGGLVSPEYDNNPWNYKFTWNPKNVVLAGQSTAMYIENGKYKYVPYQQLFKRTYEIELPKVGKFEVYPNRNSLSYMETYGIEGIPTLMRGTMRRPGYAKAWNVFVQIGATDNSYKLKNSENLTYREFIDSFLPHCTKKSVEEKLAEACSIEPNGKVIKKLEWLGIFEDKKIDIPNASPAQILQKLLEQKWTLAENDKDMIVMQHLFEYELNGKKKKRSSSMVVFGKDTTQTAMAITVGTPLGIAVKLFMKGKIKAKGVKIPTEAGIYLPVLEELKEHGINFIEVEEDL